MLFGEKHRTNALKGTPANVTFRETLNSSIKEAQVPQRMLQDTDEGATGAKMIPKDCSIRIRELFDTSSELAHDWQQWQKF